MVETLFLHSIALVFFRWLAAEDTPPSLAQLAFHQVAV